MTVEYAYTALNSGTLSCQVGAGLTTNISEGGLGFYTDHSLEAGQDLTLYSRQIGEQPLSAEVKWCTRLTASLYKVGVMLN